MKYYLAGPMQGIPQFNFPLFFKVAEWLREKGYEVISPAEIDDAEDKGAAMKSTDGILKKSDKTWGDFLSRDVKMLADDGIGGIIFLPNWSNSRGAKLEAFVGLLNNFEFHQIQLDRFGTIGMQRLSKTEVLDKIHASMFIHLVDHNGVKSAEKLAMGKEA